MWIGIDPGQSGGVAMVTDEGEWVGGRRMPVRVFGKRKLVDTRALTEWLGAIRPYGRESVLRGVVVEQVSAMPRQGATSGFNFGRHAGAVEGWVLGLQVDPVFVTPSVWKRRLGLSSDKQQSLDMAKLLFGPLSLWNVKANDGIAEAGLLAVHCRE